MDRPNPLLTAFVTQAQVTRNSETAAVLLAAALRISQVRPSPLASMASILRNRTADDLPSMLYNEAPLNPYQAGPLSSNRI